MQRRRRQPSAENGAVARAAYEALRSGDLPGVGSSFADDVVWEAPDTLPSGGVIHGRDAVLEQ
jgi:ketosteroid isomerase-like protein